MTMRRDFLAFTAGAVVAKTVLPLAARASPVEPIYVHNSREVRLLVIFRSLTPHAQEAALRFLERVAGGMPVQAAGDLMRREVAL